MDRYLFSNEELTSKANISKTKTLDNIMFIQCKWVADISTYLLENNKNSIRSEKFSVGPLEEFSYHVEMNIDAKKRIKIKRKYAVEIQLKFVNDEYIDKYIWDAYAVSLHGQEFLFDHHSDRVCKAILENDLYLLKEKYLIITCEALVNINFNKYKNIQDYSIGDQSQLLDYELIGLDSIGKWGFCRSCLNITYKLQLSLEKVQNNGFLILEEEITNIIPDLRFKFLFTMMTDWIKDKKWRGPEFVRIFPVVDLGEYAFHWKVWLLNTQLNCARFNRYHSKDTVILRNSTHEWKDFEHPDGTCVLLAQIIIAHTKNISIPPRCKQMESFHSHPDWLKKTSELMGNEETSDIILWTSEGEVKEELKTHKLLLSAHSPKFKNMFSENPEKNSFEVPFPLVFVRDFLKYIYSGEMEELNNNKAENLLKITNYYEVEELKNICEQFLEINMTKENSIHLLQLSHTFKAKKLKSFTLNFINENAQLFTSKELSYLNSDILAELYYETTVKSCNRNIQDETKNLNQNT